MTTTLLWWFGITEGRYCRPWKSLRQLPDKRICQVCPTESETDRQKVKQTGETIRAQHVLIGAVDWTSWQKTYPYKATPLKLFGSYHILLSTDDENVFGKFNKICIKNNNKHNFHTIFNFLYNFWHVFSLFCIPLNSL